jgi:hypothetical protein
MLEVGKPMMNRKARLQQNTHAGMAPTDHKAKAEGDAISKLCLMRPHAIGSQAVPILWNTSPTRALYRKADEQARTAEILRVLNLDSNQELSHI